MHTLDEIKKRTEPLTLQICQLITERIWLISELERAEKIIAELTKVDNGKTAGPGKAGE